MNLVISRGSPFASRSALVVAKGKNVGDAKAGVPGNMFVPIEHLRPVMGDLLASQLCTMRSKRCGRSLS